MTLEDQLDLLATLDTSRKISNSVLLGLLGFCRRTTVQLVDMRAAVFFFSVMLLLSGKGSFSFNDEFQLALSQFSKNLALEIYPAIKWYCILVLER